MGIDVVLARADTPGCENVLHLNNAGASLPPTPVLERVKAHLDLEATMGGYEAEDRVEDECEGVYGSIARMLGCAAGEIALVENATRAWDAAFYALAEGFQPGDKILTASNEYVSNYLAFLQVARKRGVEIIVAPNEPGGEISLAALEAAIRQHGERVKLIALTHVPTNGGLVQPALAVGRIARRNQIPYLLDACQSAGQMPLDVQQLGCDMLAATGRKYLRGPRGTGFLYIRKALMERLEPTPLDMCSAEWTTRDEYELRDDARRFEISGGSVACRLGLGVAVEYAMTIGLDNIAARATMLAEQLRDQLARIPGVAVRDMPGSGSQPRCGIVTFTHERHAAGAIFEQMREQRINVRVTPVSSTRIDMEQRGLTAMVRASVHYYNTEEELERFVRAVAAMSRSRFGAHSLAPPT
ncbi:MAG: aminotransferase class V-fold PLP-dependent enzyme [Acidobacteriaceae bacterium]